MSDSKPKLLLEEDISVHIFTPTPKSLVWGFTASAAMVGG